MNPRPRVVAIVVHYSTPEQTVECVRHIRAQTGVPVDVVVVNNSGGVESPDRLRRMLPEERVVDTGRNLGYADGLNAGMEAAWALNPDYLWMVTPDAAADPRCLEAMVDVMDEDRQLGICGPVIDAQGEWIVGCRLVEPLGFLIRIESTPAERVAALPVTVPTDFVEGCSMLIRAEVARELGPFRLEFFLYYEECEYCLRARDRGWRLAVVPAARVHTRARKTERNSRAYYLTRNSIVLARLRRQHVTAAVARGVVETVVRSTVKPRQLVAGLRAVRDGLSLPTS